MPDITWLHEQTNSPVLGPARRGSKLGGLTVRKLELLAEGSVLLNDRGNVVTLESSREKTEICPRGLWEEISVSESSAAVPLYQHTQHGK